MVPLLAPVRLARMRLVRRFEPAGGPARPCLKPTPVGGGVRTAPFALTASRWRKTARLSAASRTVARSTLRHYKTGSQMRPDWFRPHRRSRQAVVTTGFGRVGEWLNPRDCKSRALRLHWFESSPFHHRPPTALIHLPGNSLNPAGEANQCLPVVLQNLGRCPRRPAPLTTPSPLTPQQGTRESSKVSVSSNHRLRSMRARHSRCPGTVVCAFASGRRADLSFRASENGWTTSMVSLASGQSSSMNIQSLQRG